MNKQPISESFGASAANNGLFSVVYRTYIDSELILEQNIVGRIYIYIYIYIYIVHIGPTFSCYRC